MDEHALNSDYELPQPQKLGRWKRLRMWLAKTWKSLHPSPRVRLGAAIGIFVLVFIFVILSGMYIRPGLPGILNPLGGIFIILIMAALLGVLFALILKILFILPGFLTFWGTVALGLFLFFMNDFSIQNGLVIGVFIVAAEALLGGAISRFFKGRFGREKLAKKVYTIVVILVTVAFNVYLVYWLMDSGSSEHLVEAVLDTVEVKRLGTPDPTLPGSFEVEYLTYGSGTDKRRPEFGKEASLKTEAVDATPFVEGSKGWRMKLRQWFWGFDFEKFPQNGRVWYPEGEGPFPLVLCVHGNHNMADYSDSGYAYLGKLLASRGIIFVSVDENFFNGHFFGGLNTENDGRGWMLLQHLKLWREWNRAESHPFYGKVDMDNIGLIGHSRGGEAAAIAGSFNRLSFYPDDATVEFDFGFNIKAIVAIAPSDGQYRPTGRPTPLENVNYLTLQGAHDADVSSFSGARQYNRVKFTDDRYWFKAYIYSYRSNHGQFNTVWGDNDWGKPWGMILNKKALLSGEEQRKLGSVYITAFLEIALRGKTDYIPLFRDYRRIEDWLPEDLYINRFEDSTFRVVCDFDEDVDVTTASLDGGTIETENLATWREEDLGFRRRGTKDNNVVFLGWRQPEVEDAESGEPSGAESNVLGAKPENPASYSIVIPDGEAARLNLSKDSLLVFSLALADEKPPEPEKEADGEDKKEEDDEKRNEEEKAMEEEKVSEEKEETKPIDFSIELEDSGGRKGCMPLSRIRSLPPVLKSRFTKLGKESKLYGKAYEPTLQVFEIPLSIFLAENPEFDPSSLRSIRFVFDRSPEGVVILDRVGFAEPFEKEK